MKFSRDLIKEFLFKKPFFKRFALMLIGVTVMGICVSVLKLTHLGTDPCSATNYGISHLTGLSFGNVQVIVASILLVIVLIFDWKKLGLGTIANMLVVGYVADFTTYFTSKVLGIETIERLWVRIVVMLIFLTIFIFAVALYINSGLGASAYDVLPYIIHEKLCKAFNKTIPFKLVRTFYDGFFALVGFLIGGETGVITVLMVLTLGPVIVYVAAFVEGMLGLKNE
ncbi:MAG: hypothetical protein K5888_07865 [Lachnospiraceae bacterium]|nr:hypothetical protein [Lachnospiraceae bacterium]